MEYQPSYQPAPAAPKGKGMAIASLALGIGSLPFLFIPTVGWLGIVMAIVGIVLGAISKKQLKAQGAPTGMATAGIVCSIIALAILVVVIIATIACVACWAAKGLNALDGLNITIP